MTDPGWELELERRVEQEGGEEGAALGVLERRVDVLEAWHAAAEAVSAVRRWALPIALAVVGSGMSLFNIFVTFSRRH